MNLGDVYIDGLSVRYGERRILAKLSAAARFRSLVVLGPGGAGKSTLLRAIAGALPSNAHAEGEIISRSDTGEPCDVCLVEQRPAVPLGTLLDNLVQALPHRSALTRQEQREFVRETLASLGLDELVSDLERPIVELGSGTIRRVSIITAWMSEADLILLDEPFAELSKDDVAQMEQLVQTVAKSLPIVLVTHNQARAARLADHVWLLAAGQVHVDVPADVFFGPDAPKLAKHYRRTGGVAIPHPSTPSDELAPEFRPDPVADSLFAAHTDPSTKAHAAKKATRLQLVANQSLDAESGASGETGVGAENTDDDPDRPSVPAARDDSKRASATRSGRHTPISNASILATEVTSSAVPAAARGPAGFRWWCSGSLGGMPQPGIVRPIEEDKAGLTRVGATRLVTLTEGPLPAHVAEAIELPIEHWPIIDMHAPTHDIAIRWLTQLDAWTDASECVVFHCKAGLGRTGTILAAHGVWCGLSAKSAIERARRIEPRWIQSSRQEEFLKEFESALCGRSSSSRSQSCFQSA